MSNPYYKTQLCKNFAKGACNKGKECRYAHGKNDLRPYRDKASDHGHPSFKTSRKKADVPAAERTRSRSFDTGTGRNSTESDKPFKISISEGQRKRERNWSQSNGEAVRPDIKRRKKGGKLEKRNHSEDKQAGEQRGNGNVIFSSFGKEYVAVEEVQADLSPVKQQLPAEEQEEEEEEEVLYDHNRDEDDHDGVSAWGEKGRFFDLSTSTPANVVKSSSPDPSKDPPTPATSSSQKRETKTRGPKEVGQVATPTPPADLSVSRNSVYIRQIFESWDQFGTAVIEEFQIERTKDDSDSDDPTHDSTLEYWKKWSKQASLKSQAPPNRPHHGSYSKRGTWDRDRERRYGGGRDRDHRDRDADSRNRGLRGGGGGRGRSARF